ncbi:MAG: hypothetical protein M0P01_01205 [Treponema sp.]|nr:hypothetical protein [Treponema sp.]
MSDSTDTTNELDSYGVWVKQPLKTQSDEAPVNDRDKKSDDAIADTNLADFADIDISSIATDISTDAADKLQDDTTLTTEELSGITDTIDTSEIPESSSSTEIIEDIKEPEKIDEISLEDFLDEGFSDPASPSVTVEDSSNKDKDELTVPSNESEEDVSLDDFLDSDFSVKEASNQEKIPDEAPLDIDLSFSDDQPEGESVNPLEQEEAVDFDASDVPEKTSENTESIDADNLDDMFNSITDTSQETESSPVAEIGSDDETKGEISDSVTADTENVALSDFGVDADAEETPVTTNISEKKSKPANIDYDLTVTEEDDVSAAPVVNEVKSDSGNSNIPDSFDEETNSLIGTTSEKPKISSETTSVDNTLLQQIVSDLSGLKKEISNLKNDFAELKAHEATASDTETKKLTKGGFFAEEDADETISLSGDELDNIMNTADFSNNKEVGSENKTDETDSVSTSPKEKINEYEEITTSDELESIPQSELKNEPAEELTDDNLFGTIDSSIDVPETPAVDDLKSSDLTMNFDNEKLEEPNLDISAFSVDSTEEAIPDELPEEISIPKVDDILVESSSTDFMDFVKDTTTETSLPVSDDTVTERTDLNYNEDIQAPEEYSDLPETDNLSIESSETETSDKQKIEDDTNPDKVLSEEISDSDSLTKDNIDYLNTDEIAKNELNADITADTEKSNDITEPVSDSSDPQKKSAQESKKEDLPGDLTQEVKSVLLYMDQLLENLPEDKIIEFARSEHFATYKKLFSDLGLS